MAHSHSEPQPNTTRTAGRLSKLLCAAASARSRRVMRWRTSELIIDQSAGTGDPRFVAGKMLDELLMQPLPRMIDAGAYLSRAATLQLMSASRISHMESRIQKLRMSSRRARALGAAITELIHFIESGVPRYGFSSLYLVIAREEGRIIVGLSAEGDYNLVGSASGSRSLMRAIAVIRALKGDFGRGSGEDGMVFGIILPTTRHRVR